MVATSILLLSRFLCVAVWVWGLASLWKHRECEHANQALAGALAMIVVQGLLMFNLALGYTYLFLPLSHLVLASSLTKMFTVLHHVQERDSEIEEEGVTEMVKTFSQSTLLIAATGLFTFMLQLLV